MAGAYDASASLGETPAGEADLRAIGRALWAKKGLILGPTLLAAAAALFISGSMTPKYRSEARVLVENNDTFYTQPEGTQGAQRPEIDELAVQSQVQLVLSRDLARQVVTDLKLAQMEEFDPGVTVSLPKRILILTGLSRDPMRLNTEERVLDAYFEHLNVYAVPSSRVIVVDFWSRDSETAAKVANAITERYLELQQTTKQASTRRASGWLSTQIEELSGRVAEAEAKVEDFRSTSNLYMGANNATITTQQLGELNTELARVRGQEADARAKAELIRDTLKNKRPLESLDLANSELIRELSQQRVQLAAAVARDSRTYLPAHPRMKELKAQVDSLDAQIKEEGAKLARAYENEAQLTADRVVSLQGTIEAQKKVAGSAGGQEVQLRALEREAKAQRDLLEQFLARYRDAAARERVDASPPDARVISRAVPTNTPYSPRPLAITLLTTIGTFVLLVVGITASEFMIVPGSTAELAAPLRPVPVIADTLVPEPAPLVGEPVPAPSEPPPEPEPSVAKEDETTVPSDVTVVDAPPIVDATADVASPAEPFAAFGKINTPQTGTPQSEQMAIEAADMRMLGELATHLASMPKGEDGALNILTVAAAAGVDPGNVALSLARSIAGAGRKAIIVDAGSGSREYATALPNPNDAGTGELIAGTTSFGQAIQRDRASAAHMIAAGAPGLLAGPALGRIGVALDALGLTYDFVIVLSPSTDRMTEVATLAKKAGAAILVAHAQDAAANAAHRALAGEGIGDVILLLTDGAAARAAERVS